VLERSNPGEGLTRVEFAVGEPGIDHRATVHGAALDAAARLGVGVADLPEAVVSLREENDRLSDDLADLRGELLDGRLRSFDAVADGGDGPTWLVGTVEGFEANAVGEAAKRVADDGTVVAAVGAAERPFVVVATGGSAHAGAAVDAVTDRFGGGGGGGPPFAQGGGLDADPEDVVAYLRE
jgi:alanyl-tRNA synthetase